jgi:hypothetical protein
LPSTNEATAFVVEDSAFCKKTITGTEGQIPRVVGTLIDFVDATNEADPSTIVARDSLGGAEFSRLDATEIHINNPSGDTRIELGGSGNVYMDLKNPNTDDYDLRIQASGTDPRILTDNAKLLIDATVLGLQSVTNGDVGIGTATPSYKVDVIETQTGQTSVRAYNSDTAGASSAGFIAQQGGVTASFLANANNELSLGTVSSHQVAIKTNNTDQVVVTPAGNVGIGTPTPPAKLGVAGGIRSTTATDGVGYGTGAGGTVTQLTNRTTPVTIDNVCGSITMFSAAGSTTAATFTVNNSAVNISDCIILSQRSGTNLYDLMVTAVAAGSFNITFRTTGGTATDAPVINFAVIKAVTT